MNENLDQIINGISNALIFYKIDYEIDTDDVMADFTSDLKSMKAKEAFDELLDSIKHSISNETFSDFRKHINNILIQYYQTEYIDSLIEYLESLNAKRVSQKVNLDLLEKFKFDINNRINVILKKYNVEYIDFNRRIDKKDVNYINPFWIDRSQGRHFCLFFKNIPEQEAISLNEIYSDIYARDKSELGYIYQSYHYIKNEEMFYLARGPKIKGDSNAVYVIDNLGLSLSRLPGIKSTKSRATADLVPSLLDQGYRICAQYMDNESGHYRIFQSEVKKSQPEFVNLNEVDTFLVYFSISLLIYLKLIINNESMYVRQTGVFLDSENPVTTKHIGDVLRELFIEKKSILVGTSELFVLEDIINNLNQEFIKGSNTFNLSLDLGYYDELFNYLHPEI